MFVGEVVEINEKNHLEMQGWDLVEVASQHGTPLYVYNEEYMRRKCRQYLETMQSGYNGEGRIIFAGKAFLTLAMCRLVQEEGLCLDVASGGEIYTALQAGFPREKIYFHGNNKTPAEIDMALENRVGNIVVDNLMELDYLERAAGEKGLRVDILLRVKPGVTGDTHKYIQTGQVDSKFGLGVADGQAMTAVKNAMDSSSLRLKGLHCHIGSQIKESSAHQLAAGVLMDLMQEINSLHGVQLEELNLGGGLGIRHTSGDAPVIIEDFVSSVAETVYLGCQERSLDLPRLSLEPGRSIAGEAGITLYTVGNIKDIPQTRTYAAVDGGMMDNLRPALYNAEYEAMLANRAGEEKNSVVTVAGKACESGDILIRDCRLPYPRRGDTMAVFSTGAYHYSMYSWYNRVPRPGVVFVRKDGVEEVARRATYEEMVSHELIPPHMKTRSCS